MKIYTKTGDKGETGLYGGERISKSSLRINTYGTVDELNSFIGLTVIEVKDISVKDLLVNLQNQLFILGSDLSTPAGKEDSKKNVTRISSDFITDLEAKIDFYEGKLEELKNFILPGGSKSSALLHICRTVSRRAERLAVELRKSEQIGENIVIYLNRLSDLFFVLSRFENKVSNHPDIIWQNKKS